MQRESFFKDFETPVIADDEQDEYDVKQRAKLGAMVTYMGMGILLMTLIPNPLWGRMVFVFCSLVIIIIGFMLKRSARTEAVIVNSE